VSEPSRSRSSVRVDASQYEELLSLISGVAAETTVEVVHRLTAGKLRDLVLNGWRGPEMLSTTQAALLLGGSKSEWRKACARGLIPHAVKDASNDWRLPNEAAREYYAKHLNGKRTPAAPGEASGGAASSSPSPTRSRSLPAHARGRRGPRKATLAVVRGGKP
jgi:hypothetical protein